MVAVIRSLDQGCANFLSFRPQSPFIPQERSHIFRLDYKNLEVYERIITLDFTLFTNNEPLMNNY